MKYQIILGLVLALSLTVIVSNNISQVFGQTANEIDMAVGAGGSATADCVAAKNCFSPNPFNVAPGDTVTWKNTDTVSHYVTSGHPSDTTTGTVFDSGNLIKPGGAYKFTFSNAGTYDYFCTVHPWMTGQVTVGKISQQQNPFVALWKVIQNLQDGIKNLENQINHIQLKPGPRGPPGTNGTQGPPGPQGLPGRGITEVVHLEPVTCGPPQDKGGISVFVGWCPTADTEVWFIPDSNVTSNSVIALTINYPQYSWGPDCKVIQLFPAGGFNMRCAENGLSAAIPAGTTLNYALVNP